MDGPLKLTLLDLPHVTEPRFHVASVAERAGWTRYWVTEHFEAKPGSLGSALVCAAVAAERTRTIRVGTAGILMRYYPSGIAAVQLRSLAALYPDRIDAGLAGGWTLVKDKIEREIVEWEFAAKLGLMVEEIRASYWTPSDVTPPDIWYLGASVPSARITGNLSIGYGYALQFKVNNDDPNAIAHYRKTFVPCEQQQEPRAIVAVAGFCSDSAADAERCATTATEIWAGGMDPMIVGTPKECRDKLLALAERYDVDEIAFVNLSREREPASRSIELLGEALELKKP
ncbi:MAG: LLM class flavin-dependent oxidoreductase [Kofleriaceae bacterium]